MFNRQVPKPQLIAFGGVVLIMSWEYGNYLITNASSWSAVYRAVIDSSRRRRKLANYIQSNCQNDIATIDFSGTKSGKLHLIELERTDAKILFETFTYFNNLVKNTADSLKKKYGDNPVSKYETDRYRKMVVNSPNVINGRRFSLSLERYICTFSDARGQKAFIKWHVYDSVSKTYVDGYSGFQDGNVMRQAFHTLAARNLIDQRLAEIAAS